MKTAVQRWGNSLALRIPRAYAAETRIAEGSEVELTLKSGALVVRLIARKRHSLADLLKQIKPGNRHESVSTGPMVGREVW
ncbi:MAG: AbrB/MazE/SpoVT family DNA-binding domain-containing protein [Opitutaceae bacterium]|nr:AbrB/MazE/SpoVT family DNA-binding domain-containing protein [Opitutaceae bacterium]